MSEIEIADLRLAALLLVEEDACAGYVAARKAQMALAKEMASVYRLTVEQPRRADYRRNLTALRHCYLAARERTDLAYEKWRQAQLCTDGRWTDTTGRTRGRVAVAGEVA